MSIPPKLAESEIRNLSNQAGVYCFYGVDDELLYVGKSVRIRERVRSHFRVQDDSRKQQRLFAETARIEAFRTAGDLGASLLELQHIKERKPLLNKQSRKKKQLVVAKVAVSDEYLYPNIQRSEQITASEVENVLGVFKSKQQAASVIEKLAKEHELCRRRLQIGTKLRSGPCFYRQLGQCRGACVGEESPENYNERFRDAFSELKVKSWPFDSPVRVKEVDNALTDAFVIDNWVIRDAVTKSAGETKDFFWSVDQPSTFNYDTYKQIARILLKQDTNRPGLEINETYE